MFKKMASVTVFASINLPKVIFRAHEDEFMFLMWIPSVGFVLAITHPHTGLSTRIFIDRLGCQRIDCDRNIGKIAWCSVDIFQLSALMKGHKTSKSSSHPRTSFTLSPSEGLTVGFDVGKAAMESKHTVPIKSHGNEHNLPPILTTILVDYCSANPEDRLMHAATTCVPMACAEFRKHIVEQAVAGDMSSWRVDVKGRKLHYRGWTPYKSEVIGCYEGIRPDGIDREAVIDSATVYQVRNGAAYTESVKMWFLRDDRLLFRFHDSTLKWKLDVVANMLTDLDPNTTMGVVDFD